MRYFAFILICALGCKTTKKVEPPISNNVTKASAEAPAIVYKTKADYSNLVPVLLSDDKTKIISYPHPSDINLDGKYPIPTPLINGYLLDNRGIGINVAYLKMTYAEYAQLKNVPTLIEMYSLIIDKDPLIELCNCGNKSQYIKPETELNEVIKAGILKKCKKIK